MTGAAAGVRFVLASASPARLRLLRSAGLAPEVLVSQVDEELLAGSFGAPADVAVGLATAKAADVADRLRGERRTLVLGCDSVLEVPSVPQLAGHALGKPVDRADAARRWRLMAGSPGLLHTGHCLIELPTRQRLARVVSTTVRFARLSDAEIEAYVATGEPLAVAGAFTIDGLGGAFVAGIAGDWSNVVGLSLPGLREMTAQIGIEWTSLWAADAH